MNPKDLVQIRYGEWWEAGIPEEDTKAKHTKNVKACLAAVELYNNPDRPLRILVIHGSSRSSLKSAAQELSNSQLLLRAGLAPYRDSNFVIDEISLKEHNIEPCEGCYSTASTLCGFPCNCFPWDPMQELYPLVLACDVMLVSTPVNQSAMSSRLKLFLDRLISLDGGFFVDKDQYESKGPEWRDKCIKLAKDLSSTGQLKYRPRMWGKVAAYFISSKDQDNKHKTVVRPFESTLGYIEGVAESLRDGNADYGFFHDPENWYAKVDTDPDQEMCYDKKTIAEKEPKTVDKAKLVVRKAVELAEKLRKNPVPFDGGARKNRT
jgi:multimeric flavodoxin WrbA